MSKTKRILWSAAIALLALMAFQASAQATQYSIRVFNPDGTQITAEKVTLKVIRFVNGNMGGTTEVHASYSSSTGVFAFSTTLNPVPTTGNPLASDATVTFEFRRGGGAGDPDLVIKGISIQPGSPPTKTMDLVVQ